MVWSGILEGSRLLQEGRVVFSLISMDTINFDTVCQSAESLLHREEPHLFISSSSLYYYWNYILILVPVAPTAAICPESMIPMPEREKRWIGAAMAELLQAQESLHYEKS